jgi:hypothetical protein
LCWFSARGRAFTVLSQDASPHRFDVARVLSHSSNMHFAPGACLASMTNVSFPLRCAGCRVDQLQEEIYKKGQIVREKTELTGMTALHKACQYGRLANVEKVRAEFSHSATFPETQSCVTDACS